MAAFFTSVLKYLGGLLVRYAWDYVTAWLERRRASREQQRKDEQSKKPYDQAVQNGTEQEIEQATEDRLNG